MSENKTGRYFKYAIGEIILVVIGILIALQINTWNNERLDNRRVQDFYKKLDIQIKNNITNVNREIEEFEAHLKTSKNLLHIIGNKEVLDVDKKIDSLVSANIYDYHLNLDLNTIIESKDNGVLTLVKSDSLRQSIYYLTTLNERLKERERITNEDLINHLIPYINKNLNYRNLSYRTNSLEGIEKSKLYKNDNYKVLQDQEFENQIISRMEYNKGNLSLYYLIRDLLTHIQKML